MAITFYNSKVIDCQSLTDKFRQIKLQLKDQIDFNFQPGQFVTVQVPDNIYRSYSIASLPSQLPYWEILVDLSPNGPGTKYLGALKTGNLIKTTTPRGVFVLQNTPSQNIVMGATGCGIASIKPIIEELLNKNPLQNLYFFWGLRYLKDIFYQDLLDTWQNSYPSFHYQIVLSKPLPTWPGLTGHINKHLINLTKTLSKKSSIYLCGNHDMIIDIQNELKLINFSGKIYFERIY